MKVKGEVSGVIGFGVLCVGGEGVLEDGILEGVWCVIDCVWVARDEDVLCVCGYGLRCARSIKDFLVCGCKRKEKELPIGSCGFPL
jgi:hypothetical protein